MTKPKVVSAKKKAPVDKKKLYTAQREKAMSSKSLSAYKTRSSIEKKLTGENEKDKKPAYGKSKGMGSVNQYAYGQSQMNKPAAKGKKK